jgi:hypothetical protein
MTVPVVIGEGKRLFDGIDMHALELAEVKTVGDDGGIVQIYKPKKWAGKGIRMDQPTAKRALKQMEVLVGEWSQYGDTVRRRGVAGRGQGQLRMARGRTAAATR